MPTLILNEVLPVELRRELEEDAQAQGVTLNDAATAILCKNFRVRWETSGTPYREMAERFKLRVSDRLYEKIQREAHRNRYTMRGVVLSILANHYGLAAISPQRRPRRANT